MYRVYTLLLSYTLFYLLSAGADHRSTAGTHKVSLKSGFATTRAQGTNILMLLYSNLRTSFNMLVYVTFTLPIFGMCFLEIANNASREPLFMYENLHFSQ